jgi:hypothetical protein
MFTSKTINEQADRQVRSERGLSLSSLRALATFMSQVCLQKSG